MRSLSDLVNDWRGTKDGLDKLVHRDFPKIIGHQAVVAAKANITLQGYDNGTGGVDKWPERSPATNKSYDSGRVKGKQGRYKGSVYQSSNPLLLQTHNLYNSIKYIVKNSKELFIGVDLNIVPYAQKMNEGGPGTWGKNASTNTPARQYLPKPNEGLNAKMLKAIKRKFEYERDRILKKFHTS